ncbi:hypothetical protein CYY_004398 [Polysphondylium violaceum]|uniref:DDE Tnp4 domain-containing protein n=1 Tax=Polysphondylium violaceum TaxID=133409 RepID=A0A8J4PYB8_9MYCE|nr:hypothetical protein CYY_004398 [Polysphondylium violaceum]
MQLSLGIKPETIDHLYSLINNEGFNKDYIIWVFLYFHTYMPIGQLAVICGVSYRTMISHINGTISILYEKVKYLINNIEPSVGTINYNGVTFSMAAIDSMCVLVNKPQDDVVQKTLYSKKHGDHLWKFEFIVGLDGKLLYISPAFEGSRHDKAIQDITRSAQVFPYPIFGDKGYKGATNIASPVKKKSDHLTPDEKLYNNFISPQRVIIDNFFNYIKRFKILSTHFRSKDQKEKLEKIIFIIAYAINFQLNFNSNNNNNIIYFNPISTHNRNKNNNNNNNNNDHDNNNRNDDENIL